MCEKTLKKETEDIDGYIWVIDGVVKVKNELSGGVPAAINPCEGCKVIINGLECKYIQFVSEKDCIELIPEETEDEMQIRIDVSPDNLKAYLEYIPAAIYSNKVVDKIPVNMLDLEIERTLIKNKSSLNKEQLLSLINEEGINYGIMEDKINEICINNKPGKYLIAQGESPENPKDGEIEYFFNDDVDLEKVRKQDEYGNINHKETIEYKTVNVGELLARVYKGENGKDGIDVCGKTISCREPEEIIIEECRSTKYDEDMGTVKALRSGKPSKMVNKNTVMISVVEKIVLDEVNIRTGNVHFTGDIEIKGNIFEGMKVIGKNNIYVNGSVNFSTISAMNNIHIKGGVISSIIKTGNDKDLFKDPSPIINEIIEEMNSLIENLEDLIKDQAIDHKYNDFSEMVRYMQNTKNRNLSRVLFKSISLFRKGDYYVNENLFEKIIGISKVLMGDCSQIENLEYIKKLVVNLSLYATCKVDFKVSGNVEADFFMNSEIASIGSVFIKGKGCFNSNIHADGKININGVVRGGVLSSGKTLTINKCGSETGVKTILYVPGNGKITIKHVCSDTIIKIGRAQYTFLKDQKLVDARLENGKIVF